MARGRNGLPQNRKVKSHEKEEISPEKRRSAVLAHHRESRLAREGQRTKAISLRLPVDILNEIEKLRQAATIEGSAPTLSEFLIDIITYNLGLDKNR